MKNQYKVLSIFKLFHKEILNQFGCSFKVLHSDNTFEYIKSAFQEYYASFGIINQITCTHTPQNGVTQRNHYLIDIATYNHDTHMHVIKYFWGDTLLTALVSD